jgi:predicted membrane-bound mannosyltransferase
MSRPQDEVRGFKAVFTIIGVIYVLLASTMLVPGGVAIMRDFGVPETVIASPVFQDFFVFFYQFMAVVGILMVLFGHVTRPGAAQLLTARVFFVLNLLCAWRDLSTSDSRFGNHLYQSEKTLVFVYISLTFAAAFGFLAFRRRAGASV